MKRFKRISMSSLLLTTVLALPINAQQQSPRGPSEPAGRQDTATTPNVQQPSDSNSTTPQGPGTATTSSDANRQSSSSATGTIQPGPINSNVPGAPATTSAPNWILAIISLAIGLGIGYVMGRRSLGMRSPTGRDMPSAGRA
jgi:cobalamin biosynthesis Mg chelatase CobN